MAGKWGRNARTGAWQLLSLFMAALLALALAGEALAKDKEAEWWDMKWKFRRKVTIDPAAAGLAGEVQDAPLLVRLHAGVFDFPDAQQKGEDLRFVAQDGKTVLEHRIESYDPIDNLAFAWVKLPRLAASQQFIWLYYGNAEVQPPADTGKVYEPGYVGVFNLGESEGLPQDATAYKHGVKEFTGGQGLPGLIGKGVALNGVSDKLVLNAAPSLDFTKGLTFSAWVRLAAQPVDSVLLTLGEGGLTVALRPAGLHVTAALSDGSVLENDIPAQIAPGEWKNVGLVYTPARSIALFVDGAKAGEMALPLGLIGIKGEVTVGASVKGDRFLAAELDELQLSALPRPENFLKFVAAAQGPKEGLMAFGEGESGLKLGVLGQYLLYLGVVSANLSLDGWVIIALTLLMGLVCWLVIITKTIGLAQNDKINQEFLEAYDELEVADLLSLREEEGSFPNCSLFNLYKLGADELHERLGSEKGSVKNRLALPAMQKIVESGFVRESKRLNANLIVLTLSVAGAPFLGLLGTVYGVMNTFAALTLAGEANLTAIAPGMASALATTIIGLVVAIPALFAYNFLFVKVRDITADMSVFADRLQQNAEEFWEGA